MEAFIALAFFLGFFVGVLLQRHEVDRAWKLYADACEVIQRLVEENEDMRMELEETDTPDDGEEWKLGVREDD